MLLNLAALPAAAPRTVSLNRVMGRGTGRWVGQTDNQNGAAAAFCHGRVQQFKNKLKNYRTLLRFNVFTLVFKII